MSKVLPKDLEHQGYFFLPPAAVSGGKWAAGGHALAYCARHNTIFGVGHPYTDMVAEVNVPHEVDDFPTTTNRQGFHSLDSPEIHAYRKEHVLDTLGGLCVTGAWLNYSWFRYYSVQPSDTIDDDTYGTRSLELDADQLPHTRLYHIGPRTGLPYHQTRTSHYMCRDKMGNVFCGSGRASGVGPFGPNLFKIGTKSQGEGHYNATHLMDWAKTDDWNPATRWHGCQVVETETRKAVVFSATTAEGEWWYGSPDSPDGSLNDKCNRSKGYHSESYRAELYFYDYDDVMGKVINPEPYGRLDLTDILYNRCGMVGDLTYDSENFRLFLWEPFRGTHPYNGDPCIHVWNLKETVDPVDPPEKGQIVVMTDDGDRGYPDTTHGTLEAIHELAGRKLRISP